MERQIYYDYILEKLTHLATKVELSGKLNLENIHNFSEDFYAYLFNELYGYSLINANWEKQNADGIDLVDRTNKLIVQVSATNTKAKIEHSLSRKKLEEYHGYHFLFISIAKDATDLRNKKYNNPYNLIFNPENDIYDILSILKMIKGLDIDKLRSVHLFIKKELGSIDIIKVQSCLPYIIEILSRYDFEESRTISMPPAVEDKIQFNSINSIRWVIDEYSLYSQCVDKAYSVYDKEGLNKSFMVLQKIRDVYLQKKEEITDSDQLFKYILDEVKLIIKNSNNFEDILESMTEEYLDICTKVLVVDTFMRCKIFKNPNNYNYVATR